jgi:hypothetical protein
MKDLYFQDELDENLKNGLGTLPATERPSEAMATGRAAFMNQVESVRASVSPSPKRRHTGWIANFVAIFQPRKEKRPMWTAIVTIITVLTLALGGGGVTLAAAQSAMPDDVLYSVKTWTEDVRYDLATSDEDRLDLALQYAERRMTEIKTMLEKGIPPEQALASKYQAQIETALQLSTGMDTSEKAVQALAMVYQELLDQQMLMQQIQTQTQAQTQTQNMGEAQQLMNQFMIQAQTMLQYSLHYAQQSIQDPQFLEQQQQQQFQFQFSFSFGTQEEFVPGNPWTTDTAGSPSGSGNGFGGGDGITIPDQGQGGSPWETEVPGGTGNSDGNSANGGGTDNGNSGSNSNGGTNGGTNGGSNGGTSGGGGGGGGGK